MIQQYLGISPDKLIKAGWETLYMVGFSLIIGSIVGFFIAIVLWLTRKGGLKENPLLYTILNGFINIIRSTPFIILLVCVMPFTKIIVGTRIGTRAAIVPLVIYTAPFLEDFLRHRFWKSAAASSRQPSRWERPRSRLSFILCFQKHLLRLSWL